MSPHHRPDFRAFVRQLKDPKFRDAWLIPYANLEDLSSPKYLLHMLQARANKAPEFFAWSDSAPFSMANAMKAIDLSNFAGTGLSILLSGETTRTTYGKLVSVKDNSDVAEDTYLGLAFHIQAGIVLLETQKRLYHFLSRCIEILLPELDLSPSGLNDLGENLQRSKSTMGSAPTADTPEWRSIAALNMEAIYQLPRQFELDSLRRLATAKLDEAEDTFWALCEDPSYFQEVLEELARQDMAPVPKVLREAGRQTTLGIKDSMLQQSCRRLILDTCSGVIFWDAIKADLIELEVLRAKLAE